MNLLVLVILKSHIAIKKKEVAYNQIALLKLMKQNNNHQIALLMLLWPKITHKTVGKLKMFLTKTIC